MWAEDRFGLGLMYIDPCTFHEDIRKNMFTFSFPATLTVDLLT